MPDISEWSLVYEGFQPEQEGLREALCTLGNGYFATRGAVEFEEADGVHYPGTYLAGGYNRLQSEVNGRVIENEDLVNFPNWLPLTLRIEGGRWFKLTEVEILEYRQELDLRKGMLLRKFRFRDSGGRETNWISRRLVHMGEPHLAAIEMTLTAENWSGEIEVKSAIDGRVVNAGVARYRALDGHHLEMLGTAQPRDDTIVLKARTNQSHIEVAQAARTQIFRGASPIRVAGGRVYRKHGFVAQLLPVQLRQGEPVRIEKVVGLYDSREPAISECGLEAEKAVVRAGRFGELETTHERMWTHLWDRFGMNLDGPEHEQEKRHLLDLRLHTFHLLQVASPNIVERDVSVPARGLHGEAYRGHVFWDELFIFPFLNLRLPEITRALLKYRYRRLPEARAAAAAAGYRGAMFPWQSGSNGREESQVWHLNPKSGRWLRDDTYLQRHVNAAVAYNVWHYYQVTRDIEFLSHFGAELILEIACFWASLATYNEAVGRYEILGVAGPDEYHTAYPDAEKPGLNNNAYTNILVAWVLWRALDVVDLLPDDRVQELRERIGFTRNDCDRWSDISRKMRVVFHEDGIISQFEGYEQLEELDWEGYRKKYGDVQRLDRILESEGDSPNRYKCSKQADVLMLFYVFSSDELAALFERLGYPFSYDTIPKNIDYYISRTSHGSTLSRVVHSWVLSRGDRERSWQLFKQALESDVADIQGGTTAEGIHLGAMAGTVDLVQRGYTGIDIRGDVLHLNPCLPKELASLHLDVRYRGRSLALDVTSDTLTVKALIGTAQPIAVCVKGTVHSLGGGEVKTFRLSAKGRSSPLQKRTQ